MIDEKALIKFNENFRGVLNDFIDKKDFSRHIYNDIRKNLISSGELFENTKFIKESIVSQIEDMISNLRNDCINSAKIDAIIKISMEELGGKTGYPEIVFNFAVAFHHNSLFQLVGVMKAYGVGLDMTTDYYGSEVLTDIVSNGAVEGYSVDCGMKEAMAERLSSRIFKEVYGL